MIQCYILNSNTLVCTACHAPIHGWLSCVYMWDSYIEYKYNSETAAANLRKCMWPYASMYMAGRTSQMLGSCHISGHDYSPNIDKAKCHMPAHILYRMCGE